MAAKSEKISSTPPAILKPLKTAAAGSKDYKAAEDALDKAYASAGKAITVLGIKMATKKPDPAKLVPLMQKEQKSAEFLLNSDGKKLTLTVEIGGNKNTLGLFDLQAEKDVEKARIVLKSLVDCGLADKADLVAFDKAHADTAPDPKVLANLERLKKQYEGLNFDLARKTPKVYEELRAFGKARHVTENFDFVDAIFAKKQPQAIYAEFITVGAPNEINISEELRKPADTKAGADKLSLADLKPIYEAIVKHMNIEIIKQFAAAKVAEINKQIAAMKKG